MNTISYRIDSVLALQAEREASIENRSTSKQLEYWAKIGRLVSSKLSLSDALAVVQGLKEIKLEVPQSVQSVAIDSDTIFNNLENDRQNGTLSQKVTSARIYYEASLSKKGCLDRIDSTTGQRLTGQFENGQFKVV